MDQARRILYVDDDDGLCRLVGKLLERRGHEVVAVNCGEDAVEVARTGKFDLIAVDH